MKVRFISEAYIKDNSPITENNQMKDIFPHIDTAQEVYLQQIMGSVFYNDIISKYDTQTLNQKEIELMTFYIKPAVLYRTIYLALPFIQYNLRNKGLMVNTDDAANPTSHNEFKFMYNIIQTRAEGNENLLKKYLCDNSKDFPLYNDDSGLIKKNTNTGYDFGLLMY